LEDPLEIMVPWEEKYGGQQGEPEAKKEPEGDG
jgi:hypothetical protein